MTGQWVNGKLHGRGKITLPQGTFEGEFEEGMRHGRCFCVFEDGVTYDGFFAANKRQGRGVQCWPHGLCYDGEWHNDQQHGLGILTMPSGHVERGRWHDGVLVEKMETVELEPLPAWQGSDADTGSAPSAAIASTSATSGAAATDSNPLRSGSAAKAAPVAAN